MAGIGKYNASLSRINNRIDHGDKFGSGELLYQHAIYLQQHLAGRQSSFGKQPQNASGRGHQQGCSHALAIRSFSWRSR